MTKVLITGGAGFIGSYLTDRLVGMNYEVVIVDTLLSARQHSINPKAKIYKVDIRSTELENIFSIEKPDYVFHLAAQIDVRVSVMNPLLDSAVNVMGSINVFNNCLKFKTKKVIFMSTAAIYGDVPSPAVEEAIKKFDSPYGLHKYTTENNLKLLYKIHKMPYIIFRAANAYGPRQLSKGGDGSVVPVFIENALNNNVSYIYGDGLQTRDFIYVGDIVDACVLAVKNEIIGTFNLSSNKATSIIELVKTIKIANNNQFNLSYKPSRNGEIRQSVLDSNKARTILNWQAKTDLRTGITKTMNWMKNIK
jgi:UDP-glucose 4-epimerase